MSKRKRVFLFIIAGLFSVCILTSIVSVLSNRNLPARPESTGYLAELDKARLAEALHLKDELGALIWPGWDQAEIPILLWTEEFSFLVGYPGIPEGWAVAEGDDLLGESYLYQQTLEHTNFAVLVDGAWVASMATKWETDNFLISQFREMFPPPIKQIFPYSVLIMDTEVQITAVLHESFHAYQAVAAPQKLEAAEDRYAVENGYWEADENMREAWTEEINLLIQALEAEATEETRSLVTNFLAYRDQRREQFALSPEQVDFERLIEWEEGLAKYVELASWQVAFTSTTYQPLPEILTDPDFDSYQTFERRWSQELSTFRNQANQDSDTRFYYTGMAQAFLLDRLMPDWKSRIMLEGIWLEDLLRQAVEE
jgi:hypothetical protein